MHFTFKFRFDFLVVFQAYLAVVFGPDFPVTLINPFDNRRHLFRDFFSVDLFRREIGSQPDVALEGLAGRFGIGLNLVCGGRVRFLAKLEDLKEDQIQLVDGGLNRRRKVAWDGEGLPVE